MSQQSTKETKVGNRSYWNESQLHSPPAFFVFILLLISFRTSIAILIRIYALQFPSKFRADSMNAPVKLPISCTILSVLHPTGRSCTCTHISVVYRGTLVGLSFSAKTLVKSKWRSNFQGPPLITLSPSHGKTEKGINTLKVTLFTVLHREASVFFMAATFTALSVRNFPTMHHLGL